MPMVPKYDNLQTTLNVQPSVPFQSPTGPTPGAIAADEASQFGRAATSAGDALGKIQLDVQDQANQTRVNDAVNKARIAAQDLAYNTKTGYLTKNNASAFLDEQGKPLEQSLTESYGAKLQNSLTDIAGDLGNDRQRRMFQMHASDMAAQFQGQVESHMLKQFDGWHDATDDATAKLAGQNAQLNWNKPDIVSSSIDQAKAAIRSKAERAGLVGAPFDEAVLAGTSAVHEGVIMAALQNNNPAYAATYMKQARDKSEMMPNDILKVQGHITQADSLRQSQAAVSAQTVAAMPTILPNNFDRMLQATYTVESGNNPNAVGPYVPGQGTAKGINQVMDATNQKPGYGVVPARNNSPEERKRVGDDYLKAMLNLYGTPEKAWAAYNGGPGTLNDAMAAASKLGTPDAWLNNMPSDTRDYVAKALKIYSNGAPSGSVAASATTSTPGSPSAFVPIAPRQTEMEFVSGALARLGPNATPQAIEYTTTHATTAFGRINKSITEQGQQAMSNVQKWLFDNKDSDKAGVANVPPELMDPVMKFAPGDAYRLEGFSKAVQRGDVVTNGGLYNDIVTNMDQYAKMSPSAWNMLQTQLSATNFRELSKQRALILNGGTDTSAEGINSARVTRSLNENLASLKIPTSKGTSLGVPDPERLGGIRQFVDRSIFDAQKASGQKMTADQIDQHIHQLFASDVSFKTTLFGVPTGSSSTKLMTMGLSDLPTGAADGLKKSLIASGNKAPTDTDVLNLYRKLHVSK